jgi:hypothetical protein
MEEHFALICPECATVTLFQGGAPYPRCCARCSATLRERAPIVVERRTRSNGDFVRARAHLVVSEPRS